MTFFVRRRASAALALLPALALAACDAPSTGPSHVTYGAAVVVNSTGRSLSVIPTDAGAQTTTVPLGASGSPVSLAVRGNIAVVPMGTYPAAVVANLVTGATAAANLPTGSGATGAAFLNDTVAVVANSNLNTVSAVHVVTRTVGAQVPAGVFPQAVVAGDNRVYVIDANLVNFAPAGHGTVTVLDGALGPVGTVQLSGDNSAAAVLVGSTLYVVNSGHFGQNDGSLSVVNTATLKETKLVTGFGDFPGSIAASADGRILVGVYGKGILVYNPTTGVLERDAAHPIVPTASTSVSAIGFDGLGRLYSTDPGDCTNPGKLFRVTSETESNEVVATGVCPFALAFTRVTVTTQ
jgi:hypothetical protein